MATGYDRGAMRCAGATCWGLGLGLLGSSVVTAQEPRAAPLMLRLANLTTAAESARIGFTFDLEGPPLVDELPAGALTTLLPGRAASDELWVLPRGQVLPKSLPEPLPLPLPFIGLAAESRHPTPPGGAAMLPGAPLGAISQAPRSGPAAGLPGESMTVFLIDQPGVRGDFVRRLVLGPQAPADGVQLRVLNLVGAPALDVCVPGGDAAPVARAVPAWGLSRFTRTAVASAALTFHVAAEPACRGPQLGTVPLRLGSRGAWTLVAMRRADLPALRVLLLDEGSFLPAQAIALPVLPAPVVAAPR